MVMVKFSLFFKSAAKPEPEPETTATPEGEPGACGPAPGVNKTTGGNYCLHHVPPKVILCN